MPESRSKAEEPVPLSERIENHRKEIQFLVKQGGEQQRYEFKRTLSLGKDNTGDRLDFIKLFQALANNADIAGERCIVIGADPKEKKFFPVSNDADFDPANLSKILGSYLEPVPRFERFTLTTDEGDGFVLLVLDSNQPRPIVVKKQGHIESGKVRLEVGDIWIKKHTDTVKASRSDVDAMYAVKIEEEAEDRARKRLRHLQELGVPAASFFSGPSQTSPKPVAPDFELLVGPRHELRRFTGELIATDNLRRFRMLLELARETLVQGWDRLSVRGPGLPDDVAKFTDELRDFYTNEFLPSLEAVVELGLLLVKHDAETSWLAAVIDLLLEGFEAARGLQRLKSGQVISDSDPLRWWRPAFDIYIGIRTIASYVVLRKRLSFLGTILPRIVTIMSVDDIAATKVPVAFWPFRSVEFPEFREGRAELFWKERVGAAWGSYFGNAEHFFKSSAQLELLLEFNSYFGTNSIKDPKLTTWMTHYLDPNLSWTYIPDLYKRDLEDTTPMAEQIYDILASVGRFPAHLAVDATMLDVVFYGKQPHERLSIYGGFLHHLLRWQAEFRRQVFQYWGYAWSWPGRLGDLVKHHKASFGNKS